MTVDGWNDDDETIRMAVDVDGWMLMISTHYSYDWCDLFSESSFSGLFKRSLKSGDKKVEIHVGDS